MDNKDNTIILAILACLLWSTVYAVIKIGLQYDSPLHFAGIRFIISGLMILPFTVKPARFISMVRENWKIVVWVTLLQTLVNYILFYQGLNLVPGALGAVIVGSQPLVTAVVAAIMSNGEKLTRRKIITIIAGISGVILISAGRQALKLGGAIEMLGVVMILGANIATATSNVLVSLKSRGINPLVLSSTSLFTGGIIIYLLSIPLEGLPKGPLPREYWIALVWLSFVSSFAFSLWYKLLQRPHVRVSELNMFKFIIPVAGAILSWLLAPGEKPELLTIAGMFIITVSLLLFSKNGDKFLIRLK
ncbi:MAG TPA: DMT family transporter [Bacteroidales bacterium]|nr:DMT family transporter [Bacteroidales bacterium]HOX73742.1 DMT family transporter [Bacteroidales bacterium]HQM69320.1 DMT family transporter [Bacteroidales bacterium]